jgi:hypothetical protein
MEKVFFGVFLIVSGVIMAVSAYGAALSIVLARRSREAKGRHVPKVIVKTGFLITSSVLVITLVQRGASPLGWQSWFYLFGLCVSGAGLGMFTFDSVRELVLADVAEGKTRFEGIERDIVRHGERLDAEEIRNTAIEATADKDREERGR